MRFISVEAPDVGGLLETFSIPKALAGTIFEPENASLQTSEVLSNSFEMPQQGTVKLLTSCSSGVCDPRLVLAKEQIVSKRAGQETEYPWKAAGSQTQWERPENGRSALFRFLRCMSTFLIYK
jgi:hypothetical protein